MSENGKLTPLDVAKPYIDLANDPSTRAVGVNMVIDTLERHCSDGKTAGDGVMAAVHVVRSSKELELFQMQCEDGVGGSCDLAMIKAFEVGLAMQNADRIRVVNGEQETILFQLSQQENGA